MRPEFLRGSVEEHEARHRRRVLIVIGVLTVVATSPVLGHHLSARLSDAFAGRDHFWVVCLVAMHALLAPVHTLFHVLLITGVAYAIFDRTRAWYRMRRTLRFLSTRRLAPEDPAWKAATSAGVPHHTVLLAEQLPNPAFTTGWARPQIYVDGRLQSELTGDQLVAVLAHEYAHVYRRDPARLTLLRALGCLLFWLPAIRRLAEDVADDAEIAADDFAARGDPIALASAILQLANWSDSRESALQTADAVLASGRSIVGFQRDAMLDRRIHRLLGDDTRIVSHVTWRTISTAIAALLLAWSSGLAVAHPMTAASAHCTQHHASALGHLFCRAGRTGQHDRVCPHEHLSTR